MRYTRLRFRSREVAMSAAFAAVTFRCMSTVSHSSKLHSTHQGDNLLRGMARWHRAWIFAGLKQRRLHRIYKRQTRHTSLCTPLWIVSVDNLTARTRQTRSQSCLRFFIPMQPMDNFPPRLICLPIYFTAKRTKQRSGFNFLRSKENPAHFHD